MKKIVIPIAYILTACVVINWTAQEPTIEGKRKHKVNFYGMLTTHQDKIYKVDNISIARLYKQIPLYEVPADKDSVAKAYDPEKKVTTNILKNDPRKGIITRIDLAETGKIMTPSPNTLWTYKKKKGYREKEYIEIVIVSNDKQKTKNNYLIDLKRKIHCDEINEAGPIEKEVPFDAIKSLTIEGYKHREIDKKKEPEKKPAKSVAA